jgi:hypothetical protein
MWLAADILAMHRKRAATTLTTAEYSTLSPMIRLFGAS